MFCEVIHIKNRNEKLREYDLKYKDIPRDYDERLSYLYDILKISPSASMDILNTRDMMLGSLSYTDVKIILYEDPEGSPRPRARLINRHNLANAAISNPNFIQVYSITGAADNKYMKKLITEQELLQLDHLIYTPCTVCYDTFKATPSYFNKKDTVLAEIGMIRPINKPDWDNMGKKYSDMFNSNVWLDDTLVIDGRVRKFYSILPRIEITLSYLNMLYNKQQYNSISKQMQGDTPIYYFNN